MARRDHRGRAAASSPSAAPPAPTTGCPRPRWKTASARGTSDDHRRPQSSLRDEPRPGRRTLLRLATAGSVDDGKSTLVGRLLHDTNSVLTDTARRRRARVSRRKGLDRADLALLTDGLRAEREQGITIDVAYRYFATPGAQVHPRRQPGHVQYTRNTVTGASTADVIVLLVDARNGVVEQTRRHARGRRAAAACRTWCWR